MVSVCSLLALAAISPHTPAQAWAASTTACELSSELVPGPAVPDMSLHDVDARAGDDIWAVGWRGDFGVEFSALHYDGTSWSQVAMPAPGVNGERYLNAVAAVAPDDAWAVGSYHPAPLEGQAILLHWQGEGWTQVPLPNGTSSRSLTGVDGTASDDVWAVGGDILHWDGNAWSVFSDPVSGYTHTWEQVVARGAGDVWVAGTYENGADARLRVAHWDGTTWATVAERPVDRLNGRPETIPGFAVLESTDVWLSTLLIGALRDSVAWHSDVLRWNGTSWEVMETGGEPGVTPIDLAAAGPDDLWIVPERGSNPPDRVRSTIRHWDGTEYKGLSLPMPLGVANPGGAGAVTPDEVWVLGRTYGYPNADQPYIAHGHLPCAVAPATPQLVKPKRGATVKKVKPVLNWTDAAGTNYYELHVEGMHGQFVLDTATPEARFKFMNALTRGKTYKWWIRACNNAGCSAFSAKRQFTIKE